MNREKDRVITVRKNSIDFLSQKPFIAHQGMMMPATILIELDQVREYRNFHSRRTGKVLSDLLS